METEAVTEEKEENGYSEKDVKEEKNKTSIENGSSNAPNSKQVSVPICATVGCGKVAPLQCPKCIELKLKPAHFCSQPCFKSSYSTHKLRHSAAVTATNGAINKNKRVRLSSLYPSSIKFYQVVSCD